MTATQKAAFAQKILPEYEAEAKKRQTSSLKHSVVGQIFSPREKGRAAAKVAKLLGTNKTYVNQVKRIQRENPAVYDKLLSGEIKNIPAAVKEMKTKEVSISNPVEPDREKFEELLIKVLKTLKEVIGMCQKDVARVKKVDHLFGDIHKAAGVFIQKYKKTIRK
jgi:hypothetical protein